MIKALVFIMGGKT